MGPGCCWDDAEGLCHECVRDLHKSDEEPEPEAHRCSDYARQSHLQSRFSEDEPSFEEVIQQFQKLEVSEKTPKVRDQKSHERLAEDIRGNTPEFFDLSDEGEDEVGSEDGVLTESEADEEFFSRSLDEQLVANTAYNKGKQGYIKSSPDWRVHPMWRTGSRMEIQVCSCGIETVEENIDPGKQWNDLNEECRIYHYIGTHLNWSSKFFKVEEEGEMRELFISQFKKAHPKYRPFQVVPIDARDVMKDQMEFRKKDKLKLCNHTGRHPQMLS